MLGLGLGFGISGLGVRGLGFGARGDWEREGDTEWGRCAREGRWCGRQRCDRKQQSGTSKSVKRIVCSIRTGSSGPGG